MATKKKKKGKIVKTILMAAFASMVGAIAAALFTQSIVGPHIRLIGVSHEPEALSESSDLNSKVMWASIVRGGIIIKDEDNVDHNDDNTATQKQLLKMSLYFRNYSPILGDIDKIEVNPQNLSHKVQVTVKPLFIDKRKIWCFGIESRDFIIEWTATIPKQAMPPETIKIDWYFFDNRGNVINPSGLHTAHTILSFDFR